MALSRRIVWVVAMALAIGCSKQNESNTGGSGGSGGTGGTGGTGSVTSVTSTISSSAQKAGASSVSSSAEASVSVSASSGGLPPVYDYSCAVAVLPTTAPAMVAFDGTTIELLLGATSQAPGVPIKIYDGASTVPLFSVATDAVGAFHVVLSTGGIPVDANVRFLDGGAFYPKRPVSDPQVPGYLYRMTPQTFASFQAGHGVVQASGNAFIVVRVTSCSDEPMVGASVTTDPAGTVRYDFELEQPSSSATSTGIDGLAFIYNLPPGDVAVHATSAAHDLRSHTVTAGADVMTVVAIGP